MGPSGSGKSTLALALAGLLDARTGGRLTGEVAAGGRVGVVFQRPGDQVVMERVEDDVAFGLERLGLPRDEMQRTVPRALAAVGLAGLERRRSATLSGGEQQRLALAGAVAPAPPILVLDEPTANLDPAGARAFMERLAALRAGGTTIVLVEHRVELAWQLADWVLVLGAGGRVQAFGTPAGVVESVGPALVEAGIWLPPEVDARLGVAAPIPPAARPVGGPVVTADGVTFSYGDGRPAVRDVKDRKSVV
jgi:energy-coupling factor transporter ATP-binding protein EcfA2